MNESRFAEMFEVPASIVYNIEQGCRVADEIWLAVIERLDPPLFKQERLAALRHILDPKIEKRGGKSLRSLAQPLVQSLRDSPRPDLPTLFVEELINRLESGDSYTLFDQDRPYAGRSRIERRNQIIVYLYDYLYEELNGNPETVNHEVFGAFKVPRNIPSRHKKALHILHELLAERSKFRAPSEATLMKIVSEATNRKRRPRK